jgi:hypothetical protein
LNVVCRFPLLTRHHGLVWCVSAFRFNLLHTKLFHALKDLATSQGIFDPQTRTIAKGKKLGYWMLGKHVCKDAFARLYGIGVYPRLTTTLNAVLSGLKSCPTDQRYLQKSKGTQVSASYGQVFSYLQELYESVAETLPEDDAGHIEQPLSDDDIDEPTVRVTVATSGEEAEQEDIRRHLPPGSRYEIWRQYREIGNQGGFKVFHKVWESDFGHLLFRGCHCHTVCPVCTKHKLLIRSFAHNLRARYKQRMLYDRHLESQYKDRKWYWFLRAQSRLVTTTICLITDGMDQAKFMWPRAPWFDQHDFDSYQRPRLHINSLIIHGVLVLYTVSHADVSKSGSTTVDLLAYAFTLLHQRGVDMKNTHVYIQLDNTASTNKNNTVLSFLSAMVITGAVLSATANFLRVGHTHEDC